MISILVKESEAIVKPRYEVFDENMSKADIEICMDAENSGQSGLTNRRKRKQPPVDYSAEKLKYNISFI